MLNFMVSLLGCRSISLVSPVILPSTMRTTWSSQSHSTQTGSTVSSKLVEKRSLLLVMCCNVQVCSRHLNTAIPANSMLFQDLCCTTIHQVYMNAAQDRYIQSYSLDRTWYQNYNHLWSWTIERTINSADFNLRAIPKSIIVSVVNKRSKDDDYLTDPAHFARIDFSLSSLLVRSLRSQLGTVQTRSTRSVKQMAWAQQDSKALHLWVSCAPEHQWQPHMPIEHVCWVLCIRW
jgi:hypothetical protein